MAPHINRWVDGHLCQLKPSRDHKPELHLLPCFDVPGYFLSSKLAEVQNQVLSLISVLKDFYYDGTVN